MLPWLWGVYRVPPQVERWTTSSDQPIVVSTSHDAYSSAHDASRSRTLAQFTATTTAVAITTHPVAPVYCLAYSQ